MFRKLLLVLSVTLVVRAKNAMPPYLKKCSISDPNLNQCYIDHGNLAIPTLAKGDKKYHFPNLEPLKIEKLSIDTLSNLHMDMTDIEMHGLNKTVILAADNDVIKNNYTYTYLIPYVEITGNYELKGKILVLSLEGKGTCAFQFKNVKCVYNVGYERYTKDDVEYLRRTTSSMDFDLEHATMRFNDLFNGNKELSDEMNTVLNDNWKEVAVEFHPAVSGIMQEVVDSVFVHFLSIVPADELFDP